jgi:hypothetical protein
MCQLLGMNCNVPTDICFSFQGFRMRGGHTDEHKDYETKPERSKMTQAAISIHAK